MDGAEEFFDPFDLQIPPFEEVDPLFSFLSREKRKSEERPKTTTKIRSGEERNENLRSGLEATSELLKAISAHEDLIMQRLSELAERKKEILSSAKVIAKQRKGDDVRYARKKAATPFFKDDKGGVPPLNVEAEKLRTARRAPISFTKRIWKDKEREDLRDAVREALQRILFEQVLRLPKEQVQRRSKELRSMKTEELLAEVETLSKEGERAADSLADRERGSESTALSPDSVATTSGGDSERRKGASAISGTSFEVGYLTREGEMTPMTGSPRVTSMTGSSRVTPMTGTTAPLTEGGFAVTAIDWVLVSKRVKDRSPMECRIQWFHFEDPRVDRGKWVKEEERVLLAAVLRKLGWSKVADEVTQWKMDQLKRNEQSTRKKFKPVIRTAFQCFKRYERSHNPDKLPSTWTKADDEKLKEAVELYGENNWQEVASYMGNRRGHQCLHRWGKVVAPQIRKGRWKKEEDICLMAAWEVYGSKWVKVASHVPGRTDVQCRERFHNVLSPDISHEKWTQESCGSLMAVWKEDHRLNEIVEELGLGSWAKVAKLLGGARTDNQCWRRWKELHPGDYRDYSKSRKKRKTTIVRNFCGREKERPAVIMEEVAQSQSTVEDRPPPPIDVSSATSAVETDNQ